MARIRSVHPSLFTDEAWVSCSPLARVLYIGLLTEADDHGLFEWKPLQIKMRVLPADALDVGPLLDELIAADLVGRLESDGKTLGAIRRYCKFQRPKKPTYVYALPAEWGDYVGVKGDDEGESLRHRLWEQQDGACYYCSTDITHYSKRHNSLEVDHIKPVSRGGSDDESNLCAACRACNRGKCDRSESEWRATLRARAAKEPVASAKDRLAPQMEDGGGRVEEGKLSQDDKSSFESAADGGAPEARLINRAVSKKLLVDQLWSLQPILGGKRRATRPDVAKALAAAICRGADPADILAACTAYYRLPDCTKEGGQYAKGADVLIAADRWRDFLPGGATVAPLHTWGGPARLRDAVVEERDEAFARSYLDPAGWLDPTNGADNGTILAATSMALDRLKGLDALNWVNVVLADRRAA